MSWWFAPVAAATLLAGAPPSPPPSPLYDAPCPSGVSGGLPADYERSSLVAGPLALYAVRGYADYPARFIASVRTNLVRDLRRERRPRERARIRRMLRRAAGDRYPAFEAAAAIRAGHTVTIAVAREDRAHVGFLFDARAWRHAVHGYRVSDGTPAVRFRGCTPPFAQYQGGFVADGPRCTTLEAWIDGAAEPVRRVVSFGSGDCGAPEDTRPGGPPPPPLALGATPVGIRRACRRAGLHHCPGRWPLRPGSRPHGGRDFARGAARLVSFEDHGMEGEGGHLMLGERPRTYHLRARPGDRFGRRGRDPLRIPSAARVLRGATVRGHRALVLDAPPYPRGGLHGDHVIVVWNEDGRGRLVSLHFRDQLDAGRYDRDDRIAAALAVAGS